MIWAYTGKVGSGKSLDLVKDIVLKLKSGGYVISNFPLNFDCPIGRGLSKDHYVFLDTEWWTSPKRVMKEAIRIRMKGNKKSILLAIDEAGDIFNTREWQSRTDEHDRKMWNTFFQQHRKLPLGFNVVLVSQSLDYLDKQIRKLINYEHRHRLINEYKFLKLLPIKVFVVIKGWCEGKNPKVGRDWMIYRPSIGRLYNTMRLFGHVGELVRSLEREVIEEEREKLKSINPCKNMMWYLTWEGYE